MRLRIRDFAPRAGGAALALVALAAGSPAPAAESNPLPRFLEALHIGPALEFRLAALHPVYTLPQESPLVLPRLLAAAPAEAVGVSPASKDSRTEARVDDLGGEPLWLLPGDVLRLADADYAVRADLVVTAAHSGHADVLRVSAMPEDEKPRQEPRFVGHLPGPGLLWVLLDGAKEKEMVATADDLAKEAGLATPRKSPVELAQTERLTKRVKEYVARLGKARTTSGRRELAGYAVVLDGGWAGFEVFGDPARFAEVWPRRLEGIAVEAALLELENGILETDLAEPNDPDRFTSLVKDSLLAVYGIDPQTSKLPGLGTVLRLRKDRDVGRAVVHEAGAPQHVVWLRDPARRRTTTTPEEVPFDPGVIERKFRPTEAEKRWLERRKQRE